MRAPAPRALAALVFAVIAGGRAYGADANDEATMINLGEGAGEPPAADPAVALKEAEVNQKSFRDEYDATRSKVDAQTAAIEQIKSDNEELRSAQIAAKVKMHNARTVVKDAETAHATAEEQLKTSEAKLTDLEGKAKVAADGEVTAVETHSSAQGKFEAQKSIQEKLPKNSELTFEYTKSQMALDRAKHTLDTAKYHRAELDKDIKTQKAEVETRRTSMDKAGQDVKDRKVDAEHAETAYKQATAKANEATSREAAEATSLAGNEKKLAGLSENKREIDRKVEDLKQKVYEEDAKRKTQELSKDVEPAQ